MTTLLASKPQRLFDSLGGGTERSSSPPADGPRGEPTLDHLIMSAWEGLTARRAVACPVCEAQMQPEYGVHGQPLGGRCTRCGSTLT